jgi:hypothetical protein
MATSNPANIGSQKGSTKDTIIAILSREWPLSAKEIYMRLKRERTSALTYQAAHKTIKQLLEQKVIEKEGKGYQLDKEWIKNLQDFGHSLHSAYSQDRKYGKDFVATSLYEADMFILDFVVDNLPEKKTEMAWLWSHYWIPLFLSMKEYQKLSLAAEKMDVYSVVRGKTSIDKWCAQFWGKAGAHTTFGKDYGNWPDTVAFNGIVLQAYYPKDIMKELEKTFSKAKKFGDLDIKKLFDNLFLKKTRISIITTRNQELAEQALQEAKKHFKGEKK